MKAMNHDAKSQCARILKWLQGGNKLTQEQARIKFDCWRLGARIDNLRNEGYHIYTTIIKRNGKRFAEYSL